MMVCLQLSGGSFINKPVSTENAPANGNILEMKCPGSRSLRKVRVGIS